MGDARRWVNGTGRVRWQPVTDDGHGRFYEPGYGVGWFDHEYATVTRRPFLNRFPWWARWLARARERQLAKKTWTPEETTDG